MSAKQEAEPGGGGFLVHVKRVQLSNVRGFLELDLDFTRPDGSLAGWTVLAGRNGAGKSTLLRAIALATAGPVSARILQESFAGWVRAKESHASVGVLIQPAETDQYLHEGFFAKLPKFPLWARLHWTVDPAGRGEPSLGNHGPKPAQRSADHVPPRDGIEKIVADVWADLLGVPRVGIHDDFFTLGGDSLLIFRMLQLLETALGIEIQTASLFETPTVAGIAGKASEILLRNGSWSDNNYGWFLAGYGPYRRPAGPGDSPQRHMSGPDSTARLVSLFREDASLVESVDWLREIYLRRLEGRPGALDLEQAVIRLLNDGLLPGDAIVERIDSEGLWIWQGGALLPLRELSDGYRMMAALVMDIVRSLHRGFGKLQIERASDDQGEYERVPHSGVLLIDEIELHLHVSWQKRVGFWLKRHFPNIQFMVTTHSPFICQAADPKGLIRLPAPGENRQVEHVSEDLYNTVVNGSADDAVLTELFGLDTPYSAESEKLRDEIAQLEAGLQTGRTTPQDEQRLEELRSRLPQTPTANIEQLLRKLTADA